MRELYESISNSDDEPLASLISGKYMKNIQEFPQFSDQSICKTTKQLEDDCKSYTYGTKPLDNSDFVLVKLLQINTE